VKNHLQRSYRVLGVANRAHAVARCMALRLL
jgi:DNA-binding CsgD family transcriptional regulator